MDTTAEIVIPIVTAVIGLLAGFLPIWYVRKSDRARFLRERVDEFARRLAGALDAVRYALDAYTRGGAEEDELQKAVDDAGWLVGQAAELVTGLRLRLEDPAGNEARAAVVELRQAVEALRASALDEARAAYERAVAADDAFTREARAQVPT